MSMFAATTCSSVTSPAALRENRLRRGSDRLDRGFASDSVAGASATQSPTAGNASRAAGAMTQASPHPREALAGGGVDAVDVLVLERDACGNTPRCQGANASANAASHPSSVSRSRYAPA